jgi:2-methylisocitrate lyase-like PEP mutase family enzyme
MAAGAHDGNAAARRLRDRLTTGQVLVMPGGFSPLHARMAEELGFEAFFMSGSQVAAYEFGLPDVGMVSMRDMADAARRLVTGTNLPIFADADTGYGNALNVYHTVRDYIRAGVAGLHVEDQEAPKKSGTGAGRRCIPVDEAVGKYRAAVAARNELNRDVVICARTDSVGAEGGSFEDAIERAVAYVNEAGVDLVWVNTIQSIDQMAEACRRIPGPVLPAYGGPPPGPSIEELQQMGAAVALFPAATTSVGLQATWEFLHDFRERGVAAQEEWRQRARQSPRGVVTRDAGLHPNGERIRELEQTFLPGELRRDYEHTFGHQR